MTILQAIANLESKIDGLQSERATADKLVDVLKTLSVRPPTTL